VNVRLPPLPIRALLLLMALALVVPAMLFTIGLANYSARQERKAIEQTLSRTADELANSVDREINRILTLLDSLALSKSLIDRDFAAFHARASRSVKRIGTHVLLLDPEFHMVVNTRVPYGTPLSYTVDYESARAVQSTHGPVVSNLFVGAFAKRHIFDVLTPLPSDSLPNYILIMTVEPDHLLNIMRGQKLPDQWNTGIVDRNGVIVARLLDHEQYVGQPLPTDLWQASQRSTAPFVTTSVKGERILRAVAKSQRSGWYISANVPLTIVDAPINRTISYIALGGFALTALALGLAQYFARMIIGPVTALRASALAIETEKAVFPDTSPVKEVNEVASALAHASSELKARLTRLKLAQTTAGLTFVDFDFKTNTMAVSEKFYSMFGFRPGADVKRARAAFLARVHPADRDRLAALQAEALATGQSSAATYRIIAADNSERWIETNCEISLDRDGNPSRFLATNLDVTHHKQQELQIEFLMRESLHRSNNILSVIQSISNQTARTSKSVDDFQHKFVQRLQGISASHDLLIQKGWKKIELTALIQKQLAPFIGADQNRLKLSGTQIYLSAEAAQSLGLAFHELATNATKYGALRNSEGHIMLTWRKVDYDGVPSLTLEWKESNGPPIEAANSKGFGSIFIERMITHAVGGESIAQYPSSGFVWLLRAPLDRIEQR